MTGVEAIVIDACMWQGGTFTMLDEVALPDGIGPHDIDLQALLDEAARRVLIGQKYPDDTAFRVVEDSPQDQLTLTPDELRLLIRIGSGRTFAELLPGRDRVQLAQALMQLEDSGLVMCEPGSSEALTAPQPVMERQPRMRRRCRAKRPRGRNRNRRPSPNRQRPLRSRTEPPPPPPPAPDRSGNEPPAISSSHRSRPIAAPHLRSSKMSSRSAAMPRTPSPFPTAASPSAMRASPARRPASSSKTSAAAMARS